MAPAAPVRPAAAPALVALLAAAVLGAAAAQSPSPTPLPTLLIASPTVLPAGASLRVSSLTVLSGASLTMTGGSIYVAGTMIISTGSNTLGLDLDSVSLAVGGNVIAACWARLANTTLAVAGDLSLNGWMRLDGPSGPSSVSATNIVIDSSTSGSQPTTSEYGSSVAARGNLTLVAGGLSQLRSLDVGDTLTFAGMPSAFVSATVVRAGAVTSDTAAVVRLSCYPYARGCTLDVARDVTAGGGLLLPSDGNVSIGGSLRVCAAAGSSPGATCAAYVTVPFPGLVTVGGDFVIGPRQSTVLSIYFVPGMAWPSENTNYSTAAPRLRVGGSFVHQGGSAAFVSRAHPAAVAEHHDQRRSSICCGR